MGLVERADLEYKREVNNTFLKTVSAYANYGSGTIVFGVSDEGEVIGIGDLDQMCLKIENKINDSLSPVPDYEIDIDEKDKTIHLKVVEGVHKPYLYKNKAFKRADTSTVEIDRLEFNRLILEGQNVSFEEMPAYNNHLTFDYLEKELVQHLGIERLNTDILKTLDLYSRDKIFNRAAEILSDMNGFSGIDIIRFGKSIDEILDRAVLENMSILEQFEKTIEFFEKYYCYEKIVGVERTTIEKIPRKSFREAVANAIVHRQWDVRAAIKIAMHEDYIEIVSPGGLPTGLSKDEYMDGQISLLRNPILGNLFFRLRFIEKFGTGIKRIIQSYEKAIIQPEFKVYPNSITIVLPEYRVDDDVLTEDERTIYHLLRAKTSLSRKEIEEYTDFNKAKVIRVLNQLINRNSIEKTGVGRNTKYICKN